MIVLVCTGYQTWCDAETFSGRMIGDPVTPDMYFVQNVMVKDPKIKRVRNIVFDCSEERLARRRRNFLHVYP